MIAKENSFIYQLFGIFIAGVGASDASDYTATYNYIPDSVPKDVTQVIIKDFILNLRDNEFLTITENDFKSETWSHVKYLELSDDRDYERVTLNFSSSCFKHLTQLESLHIHITRTFGIHPDAFLGLENVKTLDVSLCGRLSMDTLMTALNESYKLPSLEYVNISRLQYKHQGLVLRLSVFGNVVNRKIKRYDIVNTQILRLYPYFLSYMKALEIINFSSSAFADISDNMPEIDDLVHLKTLDLSNVRFPLTALIVPKTITDVRFDYERNIQQLDLIVAPRSVNLSGVLLQISPVEPFQFKHCFVNVTTPLNWHMRTLIAQENNMKTLDIEVQCNDFKASSITMLDLSRNGLEFLHPSILSCAPNLKVLRLFGNKMHVMSEDTPGLFDILFRDLRYLKKINLSGNDLLIIPKNIFKYNEDLVEIDLSDNKLQQVSFTLNQASELQRLLLNNNNIKILDSLSLQNLESIPTNSLNYIFPGTQQMSLYGNPLSCSVCRAKPFLQWLLSTHFVNASNQLSCKTEEEIMVKITETTLQDVEDICQRKLIIITSSILAGIFVLLLVVVTVFVLRRRRVKMKMKNFNNAINLLRKGKGKYEFAVFLSYSSDDENFVTRYVLDQLQENLSKATNIRRKLICVGDFNLRPGFMVLDETIRCMNSCTLVVSVLSDNFCQSNYCNTELQQAYQLRKPVVLIFKGKVDETVMTPMMKLLFQENVRVLFTEIDGEYVLKNTWDNVCKSLLEVIAGNL